MRTGPAAAALVVVLSTGGLAAQAPGPGVIPDMVRTRWVTPGPDPDPRPLPLGVPVAASAVLPGTGQFLQHRRRWMIFAGVEVAALVVHFDARADGYRLRDGYRDLAWSTARGSPEPRVDGDFDYYERMSHWLRSGRFDMDPRTPVLEPERRPDTYNGAQWKLAADIFLGGDVEADPDAPGYGEALDYYRRRAYPDTLTWDWSSASAELERFQGLIHDSDERFRRASLALVVVAANHVLSAVDAYVTARLGRPSPVSLGVSLVPDGWSGRRRPMLVLRVPTP
jgi:hypothetical protein